MSLTQQDLKQIQAIVSLEVTPLKEQVNDLTEQISHLPTKVEFYNSQDQLINELKTVREEQIAFHLRISRVEQHVGLV